MRSMEQSALVSGTFIVSLLVGCTSSQQKEPTAEDLARGVASMGASKVDSCQSPENLRWFDNGAYSVAENLRRTSRWSSEDPNLLPPYSLQKPIRSSNLADKWQSPFAQMDRVPSNRDEFFSRGTMYYFEFAGMEKKFGEAEANFMLESAKVVGANSIINVYRIDRSESALGTECPKGDARGQFVGSIPFFSLRTSGNRTNQMPKSSFKVKILNSEKWEKQALSQYQDYVRTLSEAPKQIASLAKEYRNLLGLTRINDEVYLALLTGDRKQFAAEYSKLEAKDLNADLMWRVGKLRNGMLWWKGQLADAVSFANASAINAAAAELAGASPEAARVLEAFARAKKNETGWPEIAAERAGQKKKSSGSNQFLGMTSINLKAMWNDPSQMREALSWYMFEKAQVVAPKHTYAKVCFGDTYRGVFSVVEQIDEGFIENRLNQLYSDKDDREKSWKDQLVGQLNGNVTAAANLYKVYMGTEDVGLDLQQLESAFASSQQAKAVPNFEQEKARVINAFVDHPARGKDALKKSPFSQISPFRDWLADADFYFDSLGGGTLKRLTAKSPNQVSAYYKSRDVESRTYQLQTEWEDVLKNSVKLLPGYKQMSDDGRKQELSKLKKSFAQNQAAPDRYRDLEKLIDAINAGDSLGGDSYYSSDAYFNAMNEVLDTKAVLRWAGMTVLLGAWDNYYMNPQNYYLLNKAPSTLGDSGSSIRFVILPWDYDQSFSMSFGETATVWWDTDILDWESMRREKRPEGGQDAEYDKIVQRPLVTHMLKNPKFRTYYLRFIDWMVYNYFHVQNVASLVGTDRPLTEQDLNRWQAAYSGETASRRNNHQVRIQKEVWDVDSYGPRPGDAQPRYWEEYQARVVKETSDPAEVAPRKFVGLQVRSPEKHLQWYNFQGDFERYVREAKPGTAAREKRCDQEAYVEPRTAKDVGQCQEIDSPQDRIYPRAWLDQQPTDKGIWSLISDSVYQEHMGLPRPRWDVMSRTGRQYRNTLIYENGFLGRRIVWKELWQERPDKCSKQFKIFEGIEHHVRERGRTAIAQINAVNNQYGVFPTQAYRDQVRGLKNPVDISF